MTSAVFAHHVQCKACGTYLEVGPVSVWCSCGRGWYKNMGARVFGLTLLQGGRVARVNSGR